MIDLHFSPTPYGLKVKLFLEETGLPHDRPGPPVGRRVVRARVRHHLSRQDGLVHVSQISNDRVEKVSDVLKEGDIVKVKVLEGSRGRRGVPAA